MRVAIVGLGPSHDDVPWEEWETWGLPWDAWSPRYDRLFEMHSRSLFETRGDKYLEMLMTSDIPIFMQERNPDIQVSEEYPLNPVVSEVGDYFGSSVAYMLALAIHESATEIGLWGFDLSDDYDHQRSNIEYLIGFARGKGIGVSVSPGLLLSRRKTDTYQGIGVIYQERYGWL